VRVVPFVVSAFALAGCDGVWDLEHLDEPTPASCEAAIGHDEDRDGLDDACDPCPFDTRNDGDLDMDGIATACDPDPTAINTVVLFSGFDEVSRRSLTVTDGGYAGDSYHVAGSGSSQLIAKVDSTAVWVIAGVDVNRLEGTGYSEIGVVFDATVVATSSQLSGFLCVLGHSSVPEEYYVETYERHRPLGDSGVDHRMSPVELSTFQGAILGSYEREAMPATSCSFVTTDDRAVGIGGTPLTDLAAGNVALFAQDVDADFRFLFIVTK